jgi:hypothetical protein
MTTVVALIFIGAACSNIAPTHLAGAVLMAT